MSNLGLSIFHLGFEGEAFLFAFQKRDAIVAIGTDALSPVLFILQNFYSKIVQSI
jgi:hypothetical protein